MTNEQMRQVLIIVNSLIMIFVALVVRALWNRPQQNGPGYFFGIEVPPSFYASLGRTWLRVYRAGLAASYLLLIIGLIVPIAAPAWPLDSYFSFVTAVPLVVLAGGSPFFVRHRLRPSTRTLVGLGVSFESRSLHEIIAWRNETAAALTLSVLWALLLWRVPHIWPAAMVLTWLALGMLPARIVVARGTFPLPSEHAEEYDHWCEASRAAVLRIADRWRWMCLAILAMIVVVQGFPAVTRPTWARPALLIGFLAVFFLQLAWMGRVSQRVSEIGRALPPAGNWIGPFGPVKPSLPGGKIWLLSYLGGLILLIVLLQPWL